MESHASTNQPKKATGGLELGSAQRIEQKEDEGAWFELRDGNGDPLVWKDGDGAEHPTRVRLAGSYSSKYRRAQEGVRTRALRRRGQSLSGEMLTVQTAEILAAVTLDWEGIFHEGEPIPCTREKAKEIYLTVSWVRDQVESFVEDHERFFGPSPRTS